MTKRCARCGTDKPLTDFLVRKDRPGLGSYCRTCRRDMGRDRRATPAGRESANRASREYGRRMRARSAPSPDSPGIPQSDA